MTSDLILKFADAEILLDDGAYRKINSQDNSKELADSLINDLLNNGNSIFLLTEEMVNEFLEEKEGSKELIRQSKLLPQEFDFQIIQDASRKSYTNGEIKDFSSYFANRYHKLWQMLTRKQELQNVQPIKNAQRS